MSRIDKAIETYEDFEAVIEGRLLRAYDIELSPELKSTIALSWNAQIAVDAAMTEIIERFVR